MTPKIFVALALADTFLACEARLDAMIERARWALGKKWRWIPSLCRAILKQTGAAPHRYRRTELSTLILAHTGFAHAWQQSMPPPQIKHLCLDLPLAAEKPAWVTALLLPVLATTTDLAQWLNVSPSELDWFADKWRNNLPSPSGLQHYHYRWVEKKTGGLRLIEIPKSRLRTMQSHILHHLLDRVPLHQAAHGFRRGHSCVRHARLHIGQGVVIRMDLKNFFSSISMARIHALFSTLGYSARVASILSRLCTHRTPSGILYDRQAASIVPWQERLVLRTAHLPQGSPCSPALANLCAYRLDKRLEALAISCNARYSRYADDLTFSGGKELEKMMNSFHVHVAMIALDEGFSVNTRKTRMMRRGVRQQVTGIVVNDHPNIRRDDFDNLKATLTNCIRHGPTSQNREGRDQYQQFLAGKIAYVEMIHAQRGQRLRELFKKIIWC